MKKQNRLNILLLGVGIILIGWVSEVDATFITGTASVCSYSCKEGIYPCSPTDYSYSRTDIFRFVNRTACAPGKMNCDDWLTCDTNGYEFDDCVNVNCTADTRRCNYISSVDVWAACNNGIQVPAIYSGSGLPYITWSSVAGTSCADVALLRSCVLPTYSCIGAIPIGNSAWDAEESQGLTANGMWSPSATDTATKCQYHITPTYSCTGAISIGNSAWDAEESQGLTANETWSPSATDTATKCQYHNCDCGSSIDTCIGATYDDSCGQSTCSGTKDCRDLNWREVSPN